MTFRLETGKPLTFFYSVKTKCLIVPTNAGIAMDPLMIQSKTRYILVLDQTSAMEARWTHLHNALHRSAIFYKLQYLNCILLLNIEQFTAVCHLEISLSFRFCHLLLLFQIFCFNDLVLFVKFTQVLHCTVLVLVLVMYL
jgi:hypothetical protein